MAKLAAILKSLKSALDENVHRSLDGTHVQLRATFPVDDVLSYFQQAAGQLENLKSLMPDLYSDFPAIYQNPKSSPGSNEIYFTRAQVQRLCRDIEQIIEIRSNSQHAPTDAMAVPRRVFLTHGRAKDWYEVQAHIEKDLKLETLELSQEPSMGQTIIEKLEANSENCDSAVIVMSGDDKDDAGQARARENVIHEIGYFQAAYGRHRIILLHEEAVSVPSNLSGIVYVPYPKDKVDASFGVLDRELKAIYRI